MPRGRPLPVFGFGSARYGILGAVDPAALDCEEADYFERFCPRMRFIAGYAGGSIHDVQVPPPPERVRVCNSRGRVRVCYRRGGVRVCNSGSKGVSQAGESEGV